MLPSICFGFNPTSPTSHLLAYLLGLAYLYEGFVFREDFGEML